MTLANVLCYRAVPGSHTGDIPDFDPGFKHPPGECAQGRKFAAVRWKRDGDLIPRKIAYYDLQIQRRPLMKLFPGARSSHCLGGIAEFTGGRSLR